MTGKEGKWGLNWAGIDSKLTFLYQLESSADGYAGTLALSITGNSRRGCWHNRKGT